ncbi:MAG: 30S ribosomal protein S15 [Chloroflexota bacterium]|jgi:small subunit ribosomal protein S15|nr:30S ribosomal protein S15 [Chloroflexota bacterium]
MALDKGKKAETIEKFATAPGDNGSSEVQIALLTQSIISVNDHLRTHKGDNHARYGLVKMVGRRRSLLKYLSRSNPASYSDLLIKLGLRK